DQQHRHVRRQRRHGFQNAVTLRLRHAGSRLVEQKNARLARERKRDLQKALLAIRQSRGALAHDVLEIEPAQELADLVYDRGLATGHAPPVVTDAPALRDREAERLHRREIAEQLIDLERARDAEAHAIVRLEAGDILA